MGRYFWSVFDNTTNKYGYSGVFRIIFSKIPSPAFFSFSKLGFVCFLYVYEIHEDLLEIILLSISLNTIKPIVRTS